MLSPRTRQDFRLTAADGFGTGSGWLARRKRITSPHGPSPETKHRVLFTKHPHFLLPRQTAHPLREAPPEVARLVPRLDFPRNLLVPHNKANPSGRASRRSPGPRHEHNPSAWPAPALADGSWRRRPPRATSTTHLVGLMPGREAAHEFVRTKRRAIAAVEDLQQSRAHRRMHQEAHLLGP